MANISTLVGCEWYFGLAFNQTDVDNHNDNSQIATQLATSILGDKLRGLAVGNEPDL